MKKFYAILLALALVFSINTFAVAKPDGPDNDNGGGNDDKGDKTVVMETVEGTWDKDLAGSWDKGHSSSKSFETTKTFSLDKYDFCNFEYSAVIGGTTINGQAQLPIQVAYFDADKTILGQGGIQIQAGYVQGGASYLNEQGFKNEMIFEGLTMRQEAFQSSSSEGVPTSFKTSMTKESSLSIDKSTAFKVNCESSEYSKGTWSKDNSGSFKYTGPANDKNPK